VAESATVQEALLETVAYVDVFDYPLLSQEAHRYLSGHVATIEQVEQTLDAMCADSGRLAYRDSYYTLPGRESIIDIRQTRHEVARALWPQAISYGRRIAAMPFVRMVAVSGSLAVDNAEQGADIDYFIISEPGRVWLSRAFAILIVRLAAQRGVSLCPNYILSADRLVFSDQSFYSAHELTQMVLVAGQAMYEQLRQANAWSARYLPNSAGHPREIELANLSWSQRHSRDLLEVILAYRLGAKLEKWEMDRKIARLSRQLQDQVHTEAAFCSDWCKGHFISHGEHTMAAFSKRLSIISEN
jgi:hypothetical protein